MNAQSIERYQVGRAPHREEKTLLSEADVLVTNARFVVGVTTVPVPDITDVTIETVQARYTPVTALFTVALACALASVQLGPLALAVALVPGALGILLLRRRLPSHGLSVATSMGRECVLWSTDRVRVERIVEALERARSDGRAGALSP